MDPGDSSRARFEACSCILQGDTAEREHGNFLGARSTQRVEASRTGSWCFSLLEYRAENCEVRVAGGVAYFFDGVTGNANDNRGATR